MRVKLETRYVRHVERYEQLEPRVQLERCGVAPRNLLVLPILGTDVEGKRIAGRAIGSHGS